MAMAMAFSASEVVVEQKENLCRSSFNVLRIIVGWIGSITSTSKDDNNNL
jgi:hypothetical protein